MRNTVSPIFPSQLQLPAFLLPSIDVCGSACLPQVPLVRLDSSFPDSGECSAPLIALASENWMLRDFLRAPGCQEHGERTQIIL